MLVVPRIVHWRSVNHILGDMVPKGVNNLGVCYWEDKRVKFFFLSFAQHFSVPGNSLKIMIVAVIICFIYYIPSTRL
jgi:hypothetical protein